MNKHNPKTVSPKTACLKTVSPKWLWYWQKPISPAGVLLNEPLEAHNIVALKCWLLCHDIKLPSSCRKRQLIERLSICETDTHSIFDLPGILYIQCRIREAKKEGVPAIDVDGSYNLTRKIWKQQVNTAPLEPLLIPPAGWKVVSADNYQDFVDKIY